MLGEFREYLLGECRAEQNSRFLVAVSGGVDSVVMASLFKSSSLEFEIAHCNFRLRGKESDADQQFVGELADDLHVAFHYRTFNTKEYAADKGISLQMAARDLRYAWFNELAQQKGYHYISVGHNRNDIAETMLLNLARGTGFRGLMGIRARHDLIIRPLLFASREMILNFAINNDLRWREDSSNMATKYYRNKIRHKVIPALESINPSFIRTAVETSKRMEQTGRLLDFLLDTVRKEVWTESGDRIAINTGKLKEYPSNEIILFELLRDYGVSQLSGDMLLHTLDTTTGRQFHTRSHTITRDREFLIITPKAVDEEPEVLVMPDTAMIDHPVQMTFHIIEKQVGFKIPPHRNVAALDADRLSFPLKLRNWRKGDRFQPLGMIGTKKLSDFLINRKVALPDKKNIRVIESNGEIVWVVNQRIDERFKVTHETRSVLIINFNE